VLLPSAFSYAAADLAPLLVAAALIGTGSMLTMLSIQQVVGDRADPTRRAAAFSWLALGASISGFTGPVLSGLLIDSFGHRATFGVLVGVVLLALVLVWVNRGLLPAHEGRERRSACTRSICGTGCGTSDRHGVDLHVWDLQTFVIGARHARRLSASISVSCSVASRNLRDPPCHALAVAAVHRMAIAAFTLFCATLAFDYSPLLVPRAADGSRLSARQGWVPRAAECHVADALALAAGPGGRALGLRSTIANSQVVLPRMCLRLCRGAAGIFWTMAHPNVPEA
jgi:MFS family permease